MILPGVELADALEDADEVDDPPSLVLPAFIGPPETKIVGMFSRTAAMSMPGMILSQLGMQTRPSKQWARTIVSTESAMISRLASEYFMPIWPMAMPSQTPMVLNSNGTPPASRMACFDHLGHLVQMNVARNDLAEAVGDADERLVHIRIGQTGCTKQGPVRRPLETLLDGRHFS